MALALQKGRRRRHSAYLRDGEGLPPTLDSMAGSHLTPPSPHGSEMSSSSTATSTPAASPAPLLPTDRFPFPDTAETTKTPPWAARTRSFFKTYWKRLVVVLVLCIAFAAMIVGFIDTDEKWDPTLRTPETELLAHLPGYGKFKGVQVVKSAKARIDLEEPVDAWLGIEYSVQPVNDLRFGLPDWPEEFEGTRSAMQYGNICMQDGNAMLSQQAEDCLLFNVFRTGGVALSEKLPVMVFLHGGAFVLGSARSFDGANFVSKSKEPLMVVTAQYRLGALGSLPSKLFEEEGLLNLGLRDQRMLLQFLQKYIGDFGGDKDRITLSGQSAGGHSVGIHQFHDYDNGNETEKLFSQAILASGAPTARSFPPATDPLNERYYQRFMTMIGCSSSASNVVALACIKSAPLATIRKASGTIYHSTDYNLTWPWQPVSNGPLLEKLGSISGENGTFYKIPTMLSSTTDEGKLFTPSNLTTNKQFIAYMSNLQPGLTKADLRDLELLYPDPSNGTGPYANSPISIQYNRVSAAYGDYAYICPVQETAFRLSSASAPVYKARFNTPNRGSPSKGVPHATDAAYFQGLTNVQFPEISEWYSSYWASFVVSGNPNTHKSEQAPTWEEYTGVGGEELRVANTERGGTGMESEADGIRAAECSWWRDEARMLRMYK